METVCTLQVWAAGRLVDVEGLGHGSAALALWRAALAVAAMLREKTQGAAA